MLNTKRIALLGFLFLLIGAIGAFFTFPSMADTEQIVEEHTFDEEITELTVESDNAKIEVMPSTDHTTKVEFELPSTQKESYNIEATVENDVLQVTAKEKLFQFLSFGNLLKSFEIKVYLPERIYQGVTADTANGEIIIEGIATTSIEAESTNGALTIRHLHTENLLAEATNGKVNLIEVTGSLNVETTNGQINLQTERIDYPINFETVNGKINIQVAEGIENAEIRADVTNGSVNIFGENSNFSIYGEGENNIDLKTVNGSITVEQ